MKHLLSLLLISFVFIGCAVKENEVSIKIPSNEKLVVHKNVDENSINETIEVIDEFNIVEQDTFISGSKPSIKIAFVYPSKIIGKYANSSVNTILGYLAFQRVAYEIKVFDTQDENIENIQKTFDDIKDQDFTKVIALFTPNISENLNDFDVNDLNIYLPLINKSETNSFSSNYVFGSISYDKQIQKLLDYSNTKNIMFYQESFIGHKLKNLYQLIMPNITMTRAIKSERNYFKNIIDDQRLMNSTLFLNTNIVQTSIILSQLTVYEIVPKVTLSTQLNYNPLLISLTQENDRNNFVVANSIDKVDDKLEDKISTYNADIVYNWVDYSTLVGVNYLYNENADNLIQTKIIDNEVIYEPKLFISTDFGFLEIK
ncbi:hypothetical protein [Poseidonibacter sp.]|uniref:hypothetical protein n=1 Tax=Poseidonibacter sp. TaxID=2321188 RepID=UPI003C71E239